MCRFVPRRRRLNTRVSGVLLLSNFLICSTGYSQELALWYRQPATDWQTQALPIGNGRLGAMIFGGAPGEHLQINENSLWTGDEKDTGRYQNLGDLYLNLNHGAPENYRRRLDLARAVHTVQYSAGSTAYRREYYASAPAQVLVLHLTADRPGAYSGTLTFVDAHNAPVRAANGRLSAAGRLDNGLAYEIQIALLVHGGNISFDNSTA